MVVRGIKFFLLGLYYQYKGVKRFWLETTKNIIFNILDLFAKNFFGIFLATLIVYKIKK